MCSGRLDEISSNFLTLNLYETAPYTDGAGILLVMLIRTRDQERQHHYCCRTRI